MKYVYEDPFCGATLFAKAVSLAFVGTRPAQAVRTRKNMIKEQLAARIAARQPGETLTARCRWPPVRPRRSYELLDEVKDLKGPVTIVLFDQERQALSYAYGRLKKLVEGSGRAWSRWFTATTRSSGCCETGTSSRTWAPSTSSSPRACSTT